ncbi:PIG-L deacetylase family protein [Paenibacillus hexagrammi]|uniref:PIG-L family deacetylase n=1 Tax=Paenibacillus hexagrammi TaxID=2908839 RepID=A0ABY3SF36_9BACL|nr:PIG-L family deacetylase [Paenibacillus sp. YPD9-1]UJF32609.1 PIG-L family deacetylase [Paenibacillus sp. YPD9-1]
MANPVAFIFAHPDDETFLCSAFIRKLADEGNHPLLLLATKGDAGNKNGSYLHASREELAAVRVREMEEAAAILGLHSITHLGYPDGLLDTVNEPECVERIADFLNLHKCPVVVTFPENGGNGHRDHMAISKLTTMAVTSGRCPYVQRLYYIAASATPTAAPAPAAVPEAASAVASAAAPEAASAATPAAAGQHAQPIGPQLDTRPMWNIKAAALRAHNSQILAIKRYFGDLNECPEIRRFETLQLVWERGSTQPQSHVLWLTEGLEKE